MAFNHSMHPRSPFKSPPDFKQLARKYPDFRQHCTLVAGGKVHFDFGNAEAIRLLSKVLLQDYFGLEVDFPEGALVPRIPQRLNYILLLEDLLQLNGLNRNGVHGIDIGVGSSCIFPLLGAKLNRWSFYASDVDPVVLQQAADNVTRNALDERIHLVQANILRDVLKPIMEATTSGAEFTFTMCNPPFFDPEECGEKFTDYSNGTGTVTNRSDARHDGRRGAPRSVTEARPRELCTQGGEVDFVRRIVQESVVYRDRVRIFTTMIGRRASWRPVSKVLDELGEQVKQRQLYSLSQGRTQRWVVAWTFDSTMSLPGQ